MKPIFRLTKLTTVRGLIAGMILGLIISGVTAFPLTWETGLLVKLVGESQSDTAHWLRTVHTALLETDRKYPFLAYGTDWLAFGHLVIAVNFVGPYRDPIRNRWVIDFGLIACAGVPILAFVAGPIRGIPFAWGIVDSLFGIIGAIPLLIVRKLISQMEAERITERQKSSSPPQ